MALSQDDTQSSDVVQLVVVSDIDRSWHVELNLPAGNQNVKCQVPWQVSHIIIEMPGAHVDVTEPGNSDAYDPSLLSVGENVLEVNFQKSGKSEAEKFILHAIRGELLSQVFPCLTLREVSYLSLVVFVVGFFLAIHFEIRSSIAVPLLVLVPTSRVVPELVFVLSSTRRKYGQQLQVGGMFLVIVWTMYVLLAHIRSVWTLNAPPFARGPLLVPLVDCSFSDGVDCTPWLQDWAGIGNCAVLGATGGSCSFYCERHGRACVRAANNSDAGICVVKNLDAPQIRVQNGCLEEESAQICVCTGYLMRRLTSDNLLPNSYMLLHQPHEDTTERRDQCQSQPRSDMIAGLANCEDGDKLNVDESLASTSTNYDDEDEPNMDQSLGPRSTSWSNVHVFTPSPTHGCDLEFF